MFQVVPQNPIEEIFPKVAKFPKLMIHKSLNVIVLFTSEKSSLVLQSDILGHPVGTHDMISETQHFNDYNLPFTIQNILE